MKLLALIYLKLTFDLQFSMNLFSIETFVLYSRPWVGELFRQRATFSICVTLKATFKVGLSIFHMSVVSYSLAVDNCDVGVKIFKIFRPVRPRGVLKVQSNYDYSRVPRTWLLDLSYLKTSRQLKSRVVVE